MRSRTRLSLTQLFLVATLGTAAAVGVAVYAFLDSSRSEILARSDALRDAAAERVGERVTAELRVALSAAEDIERAVRLGVLTSSDPAAVEAQLFSELEDHPTLSDVTLTSADLQGFDAKHEARLGPDARWQVAVYRQSADPASPVLTRLVTRAPGSATFAAELRARPPGGALLAAPLAPAGPAADPTEHGTFVTTVAERYYGKAIWSDLAWNEIDQALPRDRQRIVVSVQKALKDGVGRFAGVVRVGLLASTIDSLPTTAGADGPQRVVLCDPGGRLVARLAPDDPVEALQDDLRVVPAHVPPEVAAALAVAPRSMPVAAGDTRYLVTFRKLVASQDWLVGVIVPEDYYTRDLRSLRDRFIWTFVVALAIVLAAGGFVTRLLRRSFGRVVDSAARMRRFDFSPAPADAPVREIALVAESVERAKNSLRVLGKYAPLELVRRLHELNEEPRLGGELMEISMLFTDIEGFTSLAEKLPPDALAVALGGYLEAMTRAVQSTGGAVDKFIGDAVMAFWNAPAPQPDHALRACRAVLACQAATRELFASPAWKGLPPLFTRHGLHTARVMVGHFGAPERFNYTALGDGVNLAARLEPLCKQYGVAVLVTEAIAAPCRGEMVFRLVDRVAVKGKDEPVRVYELLGARGECDDAALQTAAAYERALEAYFARDFEVARGQLATLKDDPPSRVLVARCEALIARPPPEDWSGVYVAKSK